MPNYTNADAVLDGDTLTLTAGAGDDTISIVGGFLTGGATNGVIDGGDGVDHLEIDSVNLTDIRLINIEQITANGDIWLSADRLADLGGIQFDGALVNLLDADAQTFDFDWHIESNFWLKLAADADGTIVDLRNLTGPVVGPNQIDAVTAHVARNGTTYGSSDDNTIIADETRTNATGYGFAGDDHFYAYANGAAMFGGSGNDTIVSRDAMDVNLHGGAGNDDITLEGEVSGSTVRAGAGDDTVYYESIHYDNDDVSTDVTLRGGAGYDILYLDSAGRSLVNLDFSGFEELRVDLSPHVVDSETARNLDGMTIDSLEVYVPDQGDGPIRFSFHVLDRFSVYYASAFTGDYAENDGIDIDLRGITRARVGNPNDVTAAGFSNATVFGSDDSDWLYLGENTIGGTLLGRGGNDPLYGLADDSTAIGGSGDDEIAWSSASNFTGRGGAGDDDFFGMSDLADSRLFGGAGDDRFQLRTGLENVEIFGGTGQNTTVFYARASSNADIDLTSVRVENIDHSYIGSAHRILVNMADLSDFGGIRIGGEGASYWYSEDSTTARVTLIDAGDQSANLQLRLREGYDLKIVMETGRDETSQLDLSDASIGDGSFVKVVGGAGDETVIGSRRADVLFGGKGEDILFGRNGDDTLLGGGGQDRLFDGRGGDTLTGGRGADIFVLTNDATRDVITDFDPDRDTLDLSAYGISNQNELTLRLRDDAMLLRVGDDAVELQGLTDTVELGDLDLVF